MKRKIWNKHPLSATALTAALTLTAALFAPFGTDAAEGTATAMQLAKTEGTVSISSSSGKEVSLIDNMRLYNGYQIDTTEESYAWINLDGKKMAKLDAVSKANIRKRGKKLEILLDSGNIFFNITEPLKDDESLNIRTATMVAGIRGTSGWVEATDRNNVRISILEGTVELSVTDPATGQVKTDAVSNGETAVCTVSAQAADGSTLAISRESYSMDTVSGFVLQEVAENPSLATKIVEKGGLDLRNVTVEDAQARIKEEQAVTHQKIQEAETALSRQETNVSAVPVSVWTGSTETPAQNTTETPESRVPARLSVPAAPAATNPSAETVPPAAANPSAETTPPVTTPPAVPDNPVTPPHPTSYTVTFDAQGGINPESQAITNGGKASEPPAPSRDGYDFTGWYTDKACTKNYSFSSPVTTGFTLYAGWKIQTYTVTFDAQGGANPANQTITNGDKASEPPAPSRDGYDFTGWYTDKACTKNYSFSSSVTTGFTLYAGWKIRTYTVTFDAQGGTLDSAGTLQKEWGKTLGTLPTAQYQSTSTGAYDFGGWYTREEGGEPVSANTIVNGNMIVYAHWAVKWSYNSSTGTLTVSASEAEKDYAAGNLVRPWNAYTEQITALRLPSGITKIGDCAFFNLSNLSAVRIPNGVTSIGTASFSVCSALTNVTIPASVSSIGDGAFGNCENITDIYFGGTEEDWTTMLSNSNMAFRENLPNIQKHFSSTGPETVFMGTWDKEKKPLCLNEAQWFR